MVSIRPHLNRAADQAMRQNRKLRDNREESAEPQENNHHANGQRSKHAQRLRHTPLGAFDHQANQGKVIEAQTLDSAQDDQSVNDEIARGESIDSSDLSESQINEQIPQSTSTTQSWVRLSYPLASFFPPNDTKENSESSLHENEENCQHSTTEQSEDSTPWWQQDLSYFHDYRNHNWGASALRELNVESLSEAADAMTADGESRPTPIPRPIIRPEPNDS